MSYAQYSRDHAAEIEFGKFLDKTLYTAEHGYSDVARNDDPATQKLGIDIEFMLDRALYRCDEKAAMSYGIDTSTGKGRILNTFSFELFTTHSELDRAGKDGWLLNGDMLTDSYMLLWQDRFASEPEWKPEVVCYALVRKDALLRELARYGYVTGALRDKCDRLKQCWADHGYRAERSDIVRHGTLSRFHDKILLRDAAEDGPYFSASTTKGQFHINVVVPRHILNRISVRHGRI